MLTQSLIKLTVEICPPGSAKETEKPIRHWSDLVVSIAKENNATPAQIALVWLLAEKPWIVPIPGTTKLHRLVENIGGANLSLTDDTLSRINIALTTIKISGDRYPAQIQAKIGK